MKCLGCKKMYDNGITVCPECGRKLIDDEIELDLPQLKDHFDEIDMEPTIMIKPITEEDTSLVDDISKHIEMINEKSEDDSSDSQKDYKYFEEMLTNQEQTSEIDLASLDNKDDVFDEEVEKVEEVFDENSLSSPDSRIKRRNVLIITGIISLLVLTIGVVFAAISLNKDNDSKKDDYVTTLTKALEAYYYGEDIDKVIFLLEDIKEDQEKVKEVQRRTKTTCESWVLLFLDEKIDDKENLENMTLRYKELINGLYRYAIVTRKDGVQVRLLTEVDYESITREFDDVYSDSVDFFNSLDYYNKKDYNESYLLFNRIEPANSYYEKSITYKNKIVEEIIKILENDINRIEASMDDLSLEEKLQKYTLIEEIILDYNSVYEEVDLSTKSQYQELLRTYTSKVSEYSDLVASENPNPVA